MIGDIKKNFNSLDVMCEEGELARASRFKKISPLLSDNKGEIF
jgi:hypothetical protein